MAENIKTIQDQIERLRYNADANRQEADKARQKGEWIDNANTTDSELMAQAEYHRARDFDGKSDQDEQQIQNLEAKRSALEQRAQQIRSQIETTRTQYERDIANLEIQLSQITGE